MTTKPTWADNLKAAREAAVLTQQDLADKMGIDRARIAEYEAGKREPSATRMYTMAQILETSFDRLMSGIGQQIVTIYEVTVTKAFVASMELGTRYSLEPWHGDNRDYEGEDDGGRDYILPDGYTVGENTYGQMMIFDRRDRGCDLGQWHNSPALVSADGIVALRRA